MHSLITATTILVLASFARDHVSQAVTGWSLSAEAALPGIASGE